MLGKAKTFISLFQEQGSTYAILTTVSHFSPQFVADRIKLIRNMRSVGIGYFSWRAMIRTVWYGFTPKSYALYDFEKYDVNDYISDIDELYCWDINRPHGDYLGNKQEFYALLERRGFGEYIPEQFGCISDGVLGGRDSDLISLLQKRERTVIKNKTGTAGSDVYIIECDNDTVKINGSTISLTQFRSRLSEFENFIVTEYCQQASYIDTVFPETPNTIRMLTMNPKNTEPFVARAVHRIGSESSGPVDNFSQGGLSAEIDEEGVLGPAVQYAQGDVVWHDRHPNTGAQISGVQVPWWDDICGTILSIVRKVPELQYIGWDLIVTDDGFRIIEGNTNSDTDLIQAHRPLLIDDRIQSFYQQHGIKS